MYWICFQLFFVCIVHKLTLDTRAKKILLLLNVSIGWQWRSGFNKWHFNDNYPLTAGTSLNWTLFARLVWHFHQARVIQSSSTRYSYSWIQSIKPIQWLMLITLLTFFFLLGNAPEVYLLYLHVAVYVFFHRLYAMYPNNFLAYLRALCNEPSKRNIFQNTIKVRWSLTAFDHWSKTLSVATINYGKCSTDDNGKINKNFLYIS